MAERASQKRKNLGRSASTESTEYSISMGRSIRRKKPKERWLLTRKTWKYMADAGRKLIPEGAKNCPEDIPKIEAHFQELCRKEAKFLLWRKNSYPGALGFRKKRKNVPKKGGSCRKAMSEGEVDILKPERPKDLLLEPKIPGKFDIKKMREDFLNSPSTSTPTGIPSTSATPDHETHEDKQLVSMLEQYLRMANTPDALKTGSADFNYQELIDKLQKHLTLTSSRTSSPSHYSSNSNLSPRTNLSPYQSSEQVNFQGDYVQRSLLDTLSRYFSQSPHRDKVVSDLLTDRKALEKLYFELRKAKGFRGSRGGTGYSSPSGYHSPSRTYHSTRLGLSHRDREGKFVPGHPPPLIEVQGETIEVTYRNWGTQTLPIPEHVLLECEKAYKKQQAEEEEERKEKEREDKHKGGSRRKSSVENDDVSQSVSDTIKRYLRMARKKSVDSDKLDSRFKRVNYDRNLRNIKAKGEITKPGDDDGLNKGCQTNDEWIVTYRDLKMADVYDVSDDSRISSARSSVDIGVFELEGGKGTPTSPPSSKSGHGFLSHLLHGGKHDNKAVTATAMQKSKSSSSVMQQGSRLVAKKIFRSRSKSQTRPSQTPCSWTPRGSGVWTSVTGREVILGDTNLLHLTDIERKVLQKVAIAKLQALNLGVSVKVPTETIGSVPTKKRRPYLLKRKAITTSIFDSSRKESEKDGSTPTGGGLVFGIPLTQCVENDRLSRAAFRTSRTDYVSSPEENTGRGMARHGSRSSFSSLIDTPKDETDSCDSLMGRGIVGSVPGLLDALSCSSTADLPCAINDEESGAVPNIISECIRHLEQNGLHTNGIFRVSASKKRLRQLREDFDCGKEVSIEESQCPHDVASLLKEYLRDLPDPLLCRDLYHAFIQTQRIRNRRLQFEALQHLIQLLPPTNRDTLYALLSFLANVSKYCNDTKNALGEELPGNKMDTNNLATVFAPNILHCIKPGGKDMSDRSEDRIDIINVVRTLIDHYKQLFLVPAELLDEIYVHMMDSHPEALDQLLNKKDAIAGADESVDELDSECNSAPWTPTQPNSEVSMENAFDPKYIQSEPKKTYSREECLHEAAATGGPNVGMRIRHKDKIRERSLRRKREKYEDGLLSRARGARDDDVYAKHRSSSIESTSSTHTDDVARVLRMSDENSNIERRKSSPYILDNSGVLTASLTIPVQTGVSYNTDDDIPYIEDVDNTRQPTVIGLVKAPTIPPRRRNISIGSDSSISSTIQPITGSLSLGSSAPTTYSSPHQNTPTSVSSSMADAGHFSSPPSWTSSPPTSPDSIQTSVNYIPDDVNILKPAPKGRVVAKEMPTVQKVSFAQTPSPQTIQKVRELKAAMQGADIPKSSSVVTFPESKSEREPRFTPSITSIGNAVLRSRTADFERISKVETKPKSSSVTTPSSVQSSTVAPTTTSIGSSDRDKKKYTKRRYTDSRHMTRHIPDSETLDSSANSVPKTEPSPVSAGPNVGPLYKRRELISSVPSK
ncbi:uncharacterized protein LOC115886333 isoform X2 [Sitophilus oryzae]|uniref:Uncharacterized protein LOC115886333 isoform X2 n=1 Tax=Sitophilus oryzae TaxID=7048 RepID=A0A6J2YD05_SITOR|nr:uncharacterized protein LOC115886333 isoform X2 [Sitophilus oryzae]